MRFRLRLYFETTTFNYFFDETRPGHDDVVRLFEAVKAGEFEGYTSQYVTDELEKAQEPKRSKMLSLIDECNIKVLEYSPKAETLARQYITSGAIPASHFYDSVHIALASISEIGMLVSYNFHHINREKTRMLTSIINYSKGYDHVILCTAREVLNYGGSSGRDGPD